MSFFQEGVSTVAKGIGRAFYAAGDALGSVLDAIGLDSVGDFTRDAYGLIGNVFDPLPPEIDTDLYRPDIEFNGAGEGTPVPLVLGPQPGRVGGAPVYVDNVTRSVTEPEGGKGGVEFTPSQTITRADIFLLVNDDVIHDIKEVHGGALTIWTNATQIQQQGTLMSTEGYIGWKNYPMQRISVPVNNDQGVNLTMFQIGKDITISGWPSSQNNGVWRVVKKKKKKSAGEYVLKVRDVSKTKNPGSYGTGNTVTLVQTPGDVKKAVQQVIVQTGDALQAPLTEMEEFEPLVPAYRGFGGVLLRRVRLERVGTSLSQFQFFVQAAEAPYTVEDAIVRLIERRSMLTAASVDATNMSDVECLGVRVSRPAPAYSTLIEIMIAYDCFLREEQLGIIKFYKREQAHTVDVQDGHLWAHVPPDNDQSGFPISSGGKSEAQLDSEVLVTHVDPTNELQNSTQTQIRRGSMSTKQRRINLDITLYPDDARAIAARELYRPVRQRQFYDEINLPPWYWGLEVGDTINVRIGDDIVPIAIESLEEGDNYNLVIAGNRADAPAYTSPAISGEITQDEPHADLFTAFVLSAAALYDHLDKPGFYIAVCRDDLAVPWEGATLYKKLSDGAGAFVYTPLGEIPGEANMGYYIEASSVVQAFPLLNSWDRYTKIVVTMINGSPSSASEQEVLRGENRAWWGSELIGYTTATYLGLVNDEEQWEISGLLRGLRDTAGRSPFGADVEHTDREPFVMINGSNVYFREETLAVVTQTVGYKIVPANQDPDEVEEFEVAFEGDQYNRKGNLMPFSTAHLFKVGNWGTPGTNNCVLRCERQTRAIYDVLTGTPAPLLEEFEQYEIDIIVSGIIKRTLTSLPGEDTVTYTAADQAADGVVNSFIATTYQMSASVGRGNLKQYLVTQGGGQPLQF